MGFRNATIRQLKVPDLTTTVLTLTITGIAANSSLAGGANPNWARRIGSVAAISLEPPSVPGSSRTVGLSPPSSLPAG